MNNNLDVNDDERAVRQKAGQLFLNRMMAEITEELDGYRQEYERSAGVLEFIDKVELRFGGVEYYSPSYNEDEVYSSTATFGNAEAVEQVSSEDSWGMKFDDFAPIPLSKMTCGRLIVGNQTLSFFGIMNGPGVTDLSVNAQNEIQIVFSGTIAPCLLGGILEGLSKADKNALIAGTKGLDEINDYILFGEHLDSPEAVFIPQIIIDPGNMLQTALNNQKIIVEASKSPKTKTLSNLKESECYEDYDFRQAIIIAIGNKRDLKKINQNLHLGGICATLSYVKATIIDRTKVFHSEGDTYEAKISDGSSMKNDEGALRWVVPLHVKNVHSIASLGLSISGKGAKWRWDLVHGIFLIQNDETKARVEFYFYPDIIMAGHVPLDSFDTNHDDFQQHVRADLDEGKVSIDLFELSFGWSSIVETLNAIGLK